MNIGYDAKRAFCNYRGLGNYSRDVIRLMNSHYKENHYFLFTPNMREGLYAPDTTTSSIILPDSRLGKLAPSLWRSFEMGKSAKKHHVDLFHGLNQELPVGIQKTGIKTVVTIHDAIFIRYPELYDPAYRAIFTRKNRYSCKIADRIIAISEQTKRDAIDFFGADPSKIIVVYQGCNNIYRQPIPTEHLQSVRQKYNLPQDFILSVGAIEKRKNQGIILDAIHQQNIDIPLVIVGGATKYMEDLYAKIREYSLDKQIVVLNNVSSEDLPAIYHAALCMIYPSIFEGFGIPILEALCTQTPVITSHGSCFAETGGDAALYVNQYDAEDVADKIKAVLNNETLRFEMKKKGLAHAANFTDEKVAQGLAQVYNLLYI